MSNPNNMESAATTKPKLGNASRSSTPAADHHSTQKAWSSQTASRSSAPSFQANGANGKTNGMSVRAHDQSSKFSQHTEAHDRLLFLLANFAGLDATITLKNGDKFTGVFSGATGSQPRYILRMARQLQANGTPAAAFAGQAEEHILSFDVQDTVDLCVQNASPTAHAKKSLSTGPSFKTDVEISASSGVKQRELHRWQPGNAAEVDLSLDSNDASGGIGAWDQFAANEKLYNVRTDYDENLYTTVIDRTDPKYRRAEERATRLAREIERESAKRGADTDTGLDEEDKYSGVLRQPQISNKSDKEVYVPPSKRPVQAKSTVSGAPHDPAILFSQLARPGSSASRGTGPVTDKRVREPIDGAISSGAADSSKQPAADKARSGPNHGSGSDKPSTPISIKDITQPARDEHSSSGKKSDNYYQDVYESFKNFSAAEKQRFHKHQQAMAQQRTSNARQEKSVKLNDLRNFSQTFKLTSRVPEDLVPILAKSKEKQDEIRVKAEHQAREKEQTGDEKSPSDPSSTSTHETTPRIPPAAARTDSETKSKGRSAQSAVNAANAAGSKVSATGPPAATASNIGSSSAIKSPLSAVAPKLNVKAMEFKPNPGAASFAPGGAPSPGQTPTLAPPSKGPQRIHVATPLPAPVERAPAVFSFDRPAIPVADRSYNLAKAFNPLQRMLAETAADKAKKIQFVANGGIPQAYRTAPTWDVSDANAEKSYVDFFARLGNASPVPITRTHSNGMMPHQHQLPLHLQGNASPAQQSPRFYQGQSPQYAHPSPEDQRMHFAQRGQRNGPHGSMYGGQMPSQMQNYGYGIMPGASPGSGGPQMRPMGNNTQFAPNGPMSPMGGHMMMQQPSNSGHYANGPMSVYTSPGGAQNYAQPMAGYAGSPRGQAMAHQGSQQSHSGHAGYAMPGQGMPMMMVSPSQMGQVPVMRNMNPGQYGGPQSYAMQHRVMSGQGTNHSTPRQQQAQVSNSMSRQQSVSGTGESR